MVIHLQAAVILHSLRDSDIVFSVRTTAPCAAVHKRNDKFTCICHTVPLISSCTQRKSMQNGCYIFCSIGIFFNSKLDIQLKCRTKIQQLEDNDFKLFIPESLLHVIIWQNSSTNTTFGSIQNSTSKQIWTGQREDSH